MRKLITLVLTFSTLNSWACSLVVNSETLLGNSAGSACVRISAPQKDARGGFRVMDFDERDSGGELVEHPAMNLRPGMQKVLKSVELPGIGVMNIITLKTLNLNTAALMLLNTITISVDANGRATPDHICVKQTGPTQVTGYANQCP
jgi:hypothetical protein